MSAISLDATRTPFPCLYYNHVQLLLRIFWSVAACLASYPVSEYMKIRVFIQAHAHAAAASELCDFLVHLSRTAVSL